MQFLPEFTLLDLQEHVSDVFYTIFNYIIYLKPFLNVSANSSYYLYACTHLLKHLFLILKTSEFIYKRYPPGHAEPYLRAIGSGQILMALSSLYISPSCLDFVFDVAFLIAGYTHLRFIYRDKKPKLYLLLAAIFILTWYACFFLNGRDCLYDIEFIFTLILILFITFLVLPDLGYKWAGLLFMVAVFWVKFYQARSYYKYGMCLDDSYIQWLLKDSLWDYELLSVFDANAPVETPPETSTLWTVILGSDGAHAFHEEVAVM